MFFWGTERFDYWQKLDEYSRTRANMGISFKSYLQEVQKQINHSTTVQKINLNMDLELIIIF